LNKISGGPGHETGAGVKMGDERLFMYLLQFSGGYFGFTINWPYREQETKRDGT